MTSKSKNKDIDLRQLDLRVEQQKQITLLFERGIPALEKYYAAKLEKIESPRFKWSAAIIGLVLLTVVIASTWLLQLGKLSSESYVFLIGVIVGYLMTFLKEIVFS